MMDYKNISGNRIGQDDRMNRTRCSFGRWAIRTRNPVYPVHPVKEVLSGKAVVSSSLDKATAHRGGGLATVRGYVRKSLICRIGLLQVVDFHDICGYFHRPRGIRLLLWPVLESPDSAHASR